MSVVRTLTYPVRKPGRLAIDNSVGLLPFLEARNRLLRRSAARRIRALEDEEVSRLAPEVHSLPERKVATIIATYNRPQLVGRAVASALAQSEEDNTVIVVSDGGDVPPLPRHERLAVLPLSRHIGVLGAVRNIGIRVSRSRYVAFLDDDNRWLPNHLEDCLSKLAQGGTFVYSGIRRVLPNGLEYDEMSVPFDRGRLRNENYIDANAIVLLRKPERLFSRIPRPRGVLPPEDWEFAWRLTSRGEHARLVEPASVEYLINPDSHFYPRFFADATDAVSQRASAGGDRDSTDPGGHSG